MTRPASIDRKASSASRVRGVGLVEVLVSLVILSIGLLGAASLYVATLKGKTTSQSRLHAVNLANDMADRIRANRTAGNAYALAAGAAAATPTVNCVETQTNPAVICSAAQMATADLYTWDALLTSTLPGTIVRSITVSGANPTTYTIQVQWAEPGASALSYTLTVQI